MSTGSAGLYTKESESASDPVEVDRVPSPLLVRALFVLPEEVVHVLGVRQGPVWLVAPHVRPHDEIRTGLRGVVEGEPARCSLNQASCSPAMSAPSNPARTPNARSGKTPLVAAMGPKGQ